MPKHYRIRGSFPDVDSFAHLDWSANRRSAAGREVIELPAPRAGSRRIAICRRARARPFHGPIFIVGAMGSGSTLIRLMLDSHPNIAIPQETGFMRAYQAHQFIPLKWSGRNWARRMGWSREELDQELARLLRPDLHALRREPGQGALGRQDAAAHLARRRHGAAVPDAQFIGDDAPPGRQRRLEHEPLRPPVRARGAPRRALRPRDRPPGGQAQAQFVVLRYEDLVLRPEPVHARAAGTGSASRGRTGAPAPRGAGGRAARVVVEGTNRVDDPIDVSRITRWTKTIDEPTRQLVRTRLARIASSTATTSTGRCPHVRCAKAGCSWAGWTFASGFDRLPRTSTCVRAPSPASP